MEYYARGITYDKLVESDYFLPFNLNYNAMAYAFAPAIKIISEDGNSIGCADLETLIAYCRTVFDVWKSDFMDYTQSSEEEDYNLLEKIDHEAPVKTPEITDKSLTYNRREPLITVLKRRLANIYVR